MGSAKNKTVIIPLGEDVLLSKEASREKGHEGYQQEGGLKETDSGGGDKADCHSCRMLPRGCTCTSFEKKNHVKDTPLERHAFRRSRHLISLLATPRIFQKLRTRGCFTTAPSQKKGTLRCIRETSCANEKGANQTLDRGGDTV